MVAEISDNFSNLPFFGFCRLLGVSSCLCNSGVSWVFLRRLYAFDVSHALAHFSICYSIIVIQSAIIYCLNNWNSLSIFLIQVFFFFKPFTMLQPDFIHSFTQLSNSWWALIQKTVLSSSQVIEAVRLVCHRGSAGKKTTGPNLFI